MSTRRVRVAVAAVCAGVAFGVCGGSHADSEFGGYLKQFSAALRHPASERPVDGVASTRVRLRLRWRPAAGVSSEFAYGVSPRVQSALLTDDITDTRAGGATYRALDARETLYPRPGTATGTLAITQNIDRAWVEWSAGAADISVGRQTVAFGSGRVVNPTDVLAPYAYTALDKEERVGVDAARVRYALGAFSEMDAGVAFGDDFGRDASAYFLRGQTYAAQTDVSLLAMRFRRHALVGVDLARPIGGAGTWVEAAYTFTRGPEAADYYRVSAGVDYAPVPVVYTFAEYHLNGAGASDSDEYETVASGPAYTDGGTYLLGRNYVAVGASLQASALLAGGAQLLVNVSDSSALLAPNVEYSFAQDVYLSAGAFVVVGPGSSEFAAYADTVYSTVRLYF